MDLRIDTQHRQTAIPIIPSTILLVDNGSLEPAATVNLRETARRLSSALDRPVEPVSVLHSSAIAPAELGGRPAEILEPALARRIAAGTTDFTLIPLFFGPSGLLSSHVPDAIRRLTAKSPSLRVRLAEPVAGGAGDERLASLLSGRIHNIVTSLEGASSVIVVDHGSPTRSVTAIRDRMAAQLRRMLGKSVWGVQPASMERRAGAEFDFNAPLLADAFKQPGFNSGNVVVALMFFAPGRHAGPGGDIERICAAAEKKHPGLRVHRTAPIGPDPLLIEILADRARAVL